jgi:putative flippase GtrA
MLKKILQKSIVKYVVVGLGSLAVDYGTLLALYHGLGIHVGLASAIGLGVGFVVNFSLNKIWSFKAAGGAKQTGKQAVMYTVLVMVNLIFTSWFVSYMVTVGVGPEISKLITTAIITLWNYALYKALIFKEPEPIV